MSPFVAKKISYAINILILIFLFIWGGCKSQDNPRLLAPNTQYLSMATQNSLAFFPCSQPTSVPVLKAHYLKKSIRNMLIPISPQFSAAAQDIKCAPGPFPIDDPKINIWHLTKTPDLFTWPLKKNNNQRGEIYITDRLGFPLPAQTTTLKNKDGVWVILIPKIILEKNRDYYIYLKKKTKSWVQPVQIY